MINFTLPWPPAALSPNARGHWSKLAKAKRAYRSACWSEVLDASFPNYRPKLPERMTLDVEFLPPDRRRYDRDNLLARMKSGIDGLAQALGFDDSRIASITVSVASEPVKGGAVRVRLREENHAEDAPVSAPRGNQEAREGPCPQPKQPQSQ